MSDLQAGGLTGSGVFCIFASWLCDMFIYRNQAGVLVQVGLPDPTGMPVSRAESAFKVFDSKLPLCIILHA